MARGPRAGRRDEARTTWRADREPRGQEREVAPRARDAGARRHRRLARRAKFPAGVPSPGHDARLLAAIIAPARELRGHGSRGSTGSEAPVIPGGPRQHEALAAEPGTTVTRAREPASGPGLAKPEGHARHGRPGQGKDKNSRTSASEGRGKPARHESWQELARALPRKLSHGMLSRMLPGLVATIVARATARNLARVVITIVAEAVARVVARAVASAVARVVAKVVARVVAWARGSGQGCC